MDRSRTPPPRFGNPSNMTGGHSMGNSRFPPVPPPPPLPLSSFAHGHWPSGAPARNMLHCSTPSANLGFFKALPLSWGVASTALTFCSYTQHGELASFQWQSYTASAYRDSSCAYRPFCHYSARGLDCRPTFLDNRRSIGNLTLPRHVTSTTWAKEPGIAGLEVKLLHPCSCSRTGIATGFGG